MKKQPNFFVLSDEHYFAEGNTVKCYYHPHNDDLCIKIAKTKDGLAYLQREKNYHTKIRHKDKSAFDYLFYADYYGDIETNLGIGSIYELIKDETNQKRSITLAQYLRIYPYSHSNDKILEEVLVKFKEQLITHCIFMKDCSPHNICCRVLKNNKIEFVAIDGLNGHRDFIPLANYWHYFAKKKIQRWLTRAHLTSIEAIRKHYIKDSDANTN